MGWAVAGAISEIIYFPASAWVISSSLDVAPFQCGPAWNRQSWPTTSSGPEIITVLTESPVAWVESPWMVRRLCRMIRAENSLVPRTKVGRWASGLFVASLILLAMLIVAYNTDALGIFEQRTAGGLALWIAAAVAAVATLVTGAVSWWKFKEAQCCW